MIFPFSKKNEKKIEKIVAIVSKEYYNIPSFFFLQFGSRIAKSADLHKVYYNIAA